MIRRALLSATAALALVPAAAMAQSPSQVVPSTRADQAPPGARAPGGQAPRPAARGQTPALTPFVLRSVEVTGSSLPSERVQAAYAPFIGQTMDEAKIQALSDAIAGQYADADVALYTVVIPNQSLNTGALKVTVLEGRVTDVQIDQADAGKAGGLVAAYAEPLENETPLRRSSLQRKISLIRDIPGLATEMNLLNGEADDGVVLKLDPTLRPVQVAIGVNNRGTAFLGKTQVQGDLYLNSFLRAGDQTRVTVAAPTKDDLFLLGALSHQTPLGVDGDSLLLNASYLRTEPATTALKGESVSLGAQFSRPVIRSFDRDLFVTAGIDGVNSENALFGRTFSDDRTRALRLAVAYSRTQPRSVYYIVGSVSHGLDSLGAQTGSPDFTDLEFTKLNLRAGYNRAVGDHAVIRLKATGQLSDDALPGSEQFAIGGSEYGRGFESSIVAGDKGYAASAEVAYRPGTLPKRLAGSEAYVFADGGKVTYRARSIFAATDYDLASVGGGVRLNFQKAVMEFEASRGLDNDTAFLDDRDWRGVVTVRTLF